MLPIEDLGLDVDPAMIGVMAMAASVGVSLFAIRSDLSWFTRSRVMVEMAMRRRMFLDSPLGDRPNIVFWKQLDGRLEHTSTLIMNGHALVPAIANVGTVVFPTAGAAPTRT